MNWMAPITYFAKRFIAGEALPEALKVIRKLNRIGFFTTFDHLGESVTNKDQALNATDMYLKMLNALDKMSLDKNISVKLSQIGIDIDLDFCEENLRKILIKAGKIDAFVRIDMEGSDYTTRTLDMIRKLHKDHKNIGAVLQAMLIRTHEDVLNMLDKNISMRLCKGAYKEPADIALQKTNEIRNQYISLAKSLLLSGIYHGIATHDEAIIKTIQQFSKEHMISKDNFEFQMLMGMQRRLAKKLIAEGYRVRIYVPFGSHWLPYMLRRLRERKENVWFIVKHLFER
ncbi:MAG: proline dehydrogenase family protein [Pseudomonadota bacterium]